MPIHGCIAEMNGTRYTLHTMLSASYTLLVSGSAFIFYSFGSSTLYSLYDLIVSHALLLLIGLCTCSSACPPPLLIDSKLQSCALVRLQLIATAGLKEAAVTLAVWLVFYVCCKNNMLYVGWYVC